MQADRVRMSRREQIALEEVGHTSVRAGTAAAIVIVFTATLLTVPLLQLARGPSGDGGPPILRLSPDALRHPLEANRRVLSWMRDFERALERASPLTESLVPRLQYAITAALGAGNEQVYPGEEGWLHYRPDVDYVTSPGFLDPRVMRRRIRDADSWQTPPQPDPVRAIVDFKADLGGIPLIVVPVPAKSCLRPDTFAGVSIATPLQNPSFEEFCERLREAGVIVFDTAVALTDLRARSSELYLRTDTHWRPESVEAVARGIAAEIERSARLTAAPTSFKRVPLRVSSTGDLTRLLSLPETQSFYTAEEVRLNRVLTADGNPVRPDRSGEVLLLGDSFANIYSHDGLGWGEGAGLAEQLAFYLRRPVDTIIMNDGGAYTTRQSLMSELARGERRLEGKRVVVYEFAVRELVVGDWKLFEMPALPRQEAPPPKAQMLATAVVSAIARVPDPRSTPYNDCLIALRLTELRAEGQVAPFAQSEILAYIWGMRDRRVLPEASLAAGSTITIRLTSWADAAAQYESYQRIELDDPNALLLEPYWGEVVSE